MLDESLAWFARFGANPSISSKNMTLGAHFCASSKINRNVLSASPEYLPKQSAPLRQKKVIFCWSSPPPSLTLFIFCFATAPTNARMAAVFPVPGAPWSKIPRALFTPTPLKISGYNNGKTVTSFNACIISGLPAMESHPSGWPNVFVSVFTLPPPTVKRSIRVVSFIFLFLSRL